jgi:DNA-binding CsgD family transcriptional regulator
MSGGQVDSVIKYQEIYIENARDMKVGLQREKINIANNRRLFFEIKSLALKNKIISQQKSFNNKIYLSIIFLIGIIFLLILRINIKNRQEEIRKIAQLKKLLKRSKSELDDLSISYANKLKRMKRLKKELTTEHLSDHVSLPQTQNILEKIDSFFGNETELELLQVKLADVKTAFLKRLINKHYNLSEKEIQLASLLRAGFSSKQIAKMSFIEERSLYVKRSRLRKKLGIDKAVDLVKYIKNI